MVHGRAALTRDRALINDLWSPVFKAWWPDGKDDPSIAVLSVDVTRADYWQSGGKLHEMVGFAKAMVGAGSGRGMGEQGTVEL